MNNKKGPAMGGSERTTFRSKRTAVAEDPRLKQAGQVQGLRRRLG